MMKMKVQNLPVTFLREGKTVVAYSPALDLSTCGKNMKQAMSRFDEAVKLFFEECGAMGTLDQVLSELGWTKIRREWLPPVVISNRIETIPLEYA